MSAARSTTPPSLVTLIDGDCALCSGYARFVSRLDARGVVYFETQQSPAGRALLRKAKMPEDLSTIVIIESVDVKCILYITRARRRSRGSFDG